MGSGGGGGGVVTNAANVGAGVGLFQVLSGTVLDFRSITNGTGITWVQNVNDVQATITLAPFTTTNLAEGTNLYYTQARFDTAFAAKSTTDLAEGTNLYFTVERAQDAVGGGFVAPLVYNDGANTFSITQSGVATDGYLSSVDWNTFNNKQSTLTLGNLTDVGTDGIVITGGTGAVVGAGTSIAQHVADATHNGYLSQTDWSTFNNKQNTLTLGDFTDAGIDGITVTNGTGAVVGTGTSISQHVADATHNGYLSSADFVTFSTASSLYSPGVSNGLVDLNGLLGFPDNSVAGAGFVGEEISSSVPIGTVPLTAGAVTNITSVVLTAGDWIVDARLTYSITSGVPGQTSCLTNLSPTSATIDGANGEINGFSVMNAATGLSATVTDGGFPVPTKHVHVANATTTTIYLIGLINFSLGTMAGSGYIRALRIR